MGALSRSPSPMTMEPRILSRFSSSRIDSTATWSEYFRFPYPMVRAAAMAAFSVTRKNPISRLDSMKFLRRFDRAHSSRKQRVAAILFVFAATAYLAVLLKYNCWFSGGPDSSGYCTEAKMIASGRMSLPVAMLRELQIQPDMIRTITPIGWMAAKVPGSMVPHARRCLGGVLSPLLFVLRLLRRAFPSPGASREERLMHRDAGRVRARALRRLVALGMGPGRHQSRRDPLAPPGMTVHSARCTVHSGECTAGARALGSLCTVHCAQCTSYFVASASRRAVASRSACALIGGL